MKKIILKFITSAKTRENLICSGLAVIIGIQLGVVCGIFGQVLEIIEPYRDEHYLYLLPFLGVAGIVIILLYKKISPRSEQGLNLAIAYNMGEVDDEGRIHDFGHAQKIGKYPSAYVFLKLITNMIMLLFGASTGKEGTIATCGAAIGDYTSRIFRSRRYSRILLITGVSSAVAGLFQTPIGGMFFALEFTAAGVLFYNALIPAFIGAYTAYFVSRFLGFHAFQQNLVLTGMYLDVKIVALMVLCSIVFGIVGRLFVIALEWLKEQYSSRFKNRYLWIFIFGTAIALILMLLHKGRYSGTGGKLIDELFTFSTFNWYDFIFKFIFTIMCIAIGFTGGEMMPLMSIGALLGAALATLTGLPFELTVVMGCVAVYCSATNTLLAPIFIGIEMFGADCAIYIAIACVIAFALNGNHSVYTMQGHAPRSMYGIMKNQ